MEDSSVENTFADLIIDDEVIEEVVVEFNSQWIDKIWILKCIEENLNFDETYSTHSEISPEDQLFYSTNVVVTKEKCVEICLATTKQSDSWEWTIERKKRITASNCYGLYTYTKNKSPDWAKKAQSHINPKKFKISSCDYGKVNEPFACSSFTRETGIVIHSCGLFIHPNVSWLGCSPDGITSNNELIEVKCPVIGDLKPGSENQISFEEFCEKIPNIQKTDKGYILKKKNSWYGQIQLCLAILNVPICYLLLYYKIGDKCLVVKVTYDYEFFEDMVSKLHWVYFKHILPRLSLQNKK